ncbi:MAG: hypothetical protein HPY82_08455 [Gammaproteobacteria bacterium]|nr:hypothetical protein [Gammaproteobacteria bacterium]
MSKVKKIEGTVEAWESGALGSDERYAKLSELDVSHVQEAAGLKTISIRVQPDLLEELKLIAGLHGLGYQPLIKQILRRFVDAELKMLLVEAYKRNKQHQEEQRHQENPDDPIANCA